MYLYDLNTILNFKLFMLLGVKKNPDDAASKLYSWLMELQLLEIWRQQPLSKKKIGGAEEVK